MTTDSPSPASSRRLLTTQINRIVRYILPAGFVLLLLIAAVIYYWVDNSRQTGTMAVALIITAAWLLALTLLMTFGFLRHVLKPIETFSHELRELDPLLTKAQQITIPAAVRSNELGDIMQRFNQLLHDLHQARQADSTRLQELTGSDQMLRALIQAAPLGLLHIAHDGTVQFANAAAARLLNTRETDLVQSHIAAHLTDATAKALAERLHTLHRASPAPLLLDLRLKNNPQTELEAGILPASSDSVIQKDYLLFLTDVGSVRRLAQQNQERDEQLSHLLQTTHSALWSYDLPTGHYQWSAEFATLLGYTAHDASFAALQRHDLIHPEDQSWVMQCLQRYLAHETADYNPAYRLRHKDGHWIWVEDHAWAEWDEHGKPVRLSGLLCDCTERKRFEQQMMYMATHDTLTDLPNRTLLHDRLQHALTGNNRKGLHVAVLLVDLDRFKLINDSLGHEIGDQLIRAVAQRLQQNIRPTDTLARLAVDEFVLICEDLASPQEAARVAKRILSSISQPFEVETNHLAITVSIGISVSPVDGETVADILRHADTAMHSAKAAGGNTYRFFINEMNKEAVQRLTLERHLNEAIDRQQFVLHYQPKVDLQSRTLIGAEALIRWPHRKLGMISPLQFIPIAEETGAVLAIGEWVIREALSQLSIWRERGVPLVPIAINLSGKQLMSGGIDELILRLLNEYEIAPELLEVEVTESVMAKMDKVLPTLRRLRAAGVGIALDDFGTGYSSLAYLRQLPLSSLKIDRSFVKDVPGKIEANCVAGIILDMGRQLGLKVVAEGIETEAQLGFLREHNCGIGQGWLFDKALPASQFEQRLRALSQPPK